MWFDMLARRHTQATLTRITCIAPHADIYWNPSCVDTHIARISDGLVDSRHLHNVEASVAKNVQLRLRQVGSVAEIGR